MRDSAVHIPWRAGIVSACLLVLPFLSGCTELQEAARVGDLEKVKALLEGGAYINGADAIKSETALHLAAENGHTEVVKYLVEKGAKVNIRAEGGETPLHRASYFGHLEVIKVLLANGADVREKGTGCGMPLQWAATGGRVEAAKLLLAAAKANVDEQGTDEYTALGTAVSYEQVEMVKFLLKRGANVNARAIYGTTPLHVAAWKNNVEIGRILLAAGADPTLESNGRRVSEKFVESLKIDIGRPSRAVPVTPPCVRVRTRRFGELSIQPEQEKADRQQRRRRWETRSSRRGCG